MLILARYLEEAILIGEARVTILSIARKKNGRLRVKLGIEAPSTTPILRAELPWLERAAPVSSATTGESASQPPQSTHISKEE